MVLSLVLIALGIALMIAGVKGTYQAVWNQVKGSSASSSSSSSSSAGAHNQPGTAPA